MLFYFIDFRAVVAYVVVSKTATVPCLAPRLLASLYDPGLGSNGCSRWRQYMPRLSHPKQLQAPYWEEVGGS